METHVIITFLPTVLMQLFEVLTAATKEAHEIAVNSLRWVFDLFTVGLPPIKVFNSNFPRFLPSV